MRALDLTDVDTLEAMCRVYDREDSAERGEPSPWDVETDAPDFPAFRAGRIEAMRLACAEIAERPDLAGALARMAVLVEAWDKFELTRDATKVPAPLDWKALGILLAGASAALLVPYRPAGSKAATLAKEYRPSMDAEVLHSWAADVVEALEPPEPAQAIREAAQALKDAVAGLAPWYREKATDRAHEAMLWGLDGLRAASKEAHHG